MSVLGIARSGLDASLMRLTASASNIANAQVSGAVSGSGGAQAPRAYQPVRAALSPLAGGGVAARLAPVDPAYQFTYDPGAPHADGRGMVAAPNVDVTQELVEQLSARLAFTANLKLISTAAELERRTVQIWG